MSNESLTCSNSSFIVDLPILTPNSNTLIVVETQTGGVVEVGKVSLPEALLRSGIPLTGTQVDTWVQSNSCNVAAATAWFLVNNVKTSKNNTWVTNTSSFLLSATNWVARNSARLDNLDFTIDNLTDTALQAGTWFAANSTAFQSLSSDILTLSSDSASLHAFTNWIAANSSTLNNTVTSLTSLLIEEALEETFHNWVISNSTAFGTMLTTLRDLTSDESFIRNASQWVSSVSADVDQTVSWFKILTSVREMHEVIEMSVFAWVTANSAEVSDILEKNSQGFISWVSANSAEYENVYNWYIDNEQSIQEAVTWAQDTSSRVDILEGSVAIALETAIDSNTWITNNANTYASIGSVSALATWITNNSTTLNELQEWYGTLPTTATAIQAATDWIATNGANVIEAAQWIDTLANTQLLHDIREDQVLSWVEDNSADLNTNLIDPNATIALAWATNNSATILQAVNWVHLLTSTQEEHTSRESDVFNWVESHSGNNINTLDPNITAWVQESSSALTEVKDWYELNQLDANTINPTISWVSNISDRVTQATEWVEILTETQNLHDLREDQILTWVEASSGKILEATNWAEGVSTTVETLDLVTPFIQSFKDSAEWYTVSGDVINSATAWVNSVTGSWVSQIQLEAVRLIFNPTKAWVSQNSSTLESVANFTTSLSAKINDTITWVGSNTATLLDNVAWVGSVSDSITQIDSLIESVNAFDGANTWIQNNSSDLLILSNADIDLFDSVAAYVTEASAIIDTALDDVDLIKATYENYGEALTQQQLSITNATASAVSALQWVQDNEEAFLIITETADNLSNIIDTLTPTTSWAGRVSAGLAEAATWVVNNSSLAEVNNVLNSATTWVTQNSSEIESAVTWVSVLTSTQQLHDNREESVFSWVEENSSALIDVDNTNLDWLNQNKDSIDSNITWVVDNSSKVQESYLATRAYNAQINNLTTWLTGNSAQLKDAAEWVNTTSADIDITAIQDTINWVSTNGEALPLRVETLEVAIEGLPELQQWYSETDTQLLTDAANWVSSTSSSINTLKTKVETLSAAINTLEDVLYTSVTDVDNITTWLSESSTTIAQTTEWVQMLTSTQQLHDERESSVFTWVETHSSDSTVVDEDLIAWVQNNSSDLTDVKDWYSNKTFNDSDVTEAISWYQENSAKTTEAVQWVELLAETQGLHDVREESVLSWVEENSSSLLSSSNDPEAISWVQEHSSTLNTLEEWVGFDVLDINQLNAAATVVSETSALASKTAQWVQALSSAQNLHDVEEEQVFAWVQENSGNVLEPIDTQSDTWVKENSGMLTDAFEWIASNTDTLDAVVTVVSETSALASKTAQWVQALSSAQNLHDEVEDQVFTWVQDNSGNIENAAETTDAVSWVQDNSGNLEEISSWFGFSNLDIDQVNAATTIVSETSALALKTAQWVHTLSSVQNLHNIEEEQVFTWVQTHSGDISGATDSQSDTWVKENSSDLELVTSWRGFSELDIDQVNEVATIVGSTSALASKTAQWVQALSSAQNLHDVEEDQVFAWVQENSSNIQSASDNTEAVNWVQTNSSNVASLEEWSGFTDLNVNQVNAATTWYQENSTKASEAIQWVEMLAETQSLHNAEEDQVFAWVQENSSNIQSASDSTEAVNWVQNNSGAFTSLEEWSGFTDLNVNQLNAAATVVSETSALASKTAQWVQALSSAQNLHDVEEEQVFAWVQENSANTSTATDTESDTWVKDNSGSLVEVRDWFNDKAFNDSDVIEAVSWYQENSSKAAEAVQWIEMLSEAQNVHDIREDSVFTWVEENSSNIQDTSNSVEVAAWVQSNSGNLEEIANWFGFSDLDVEQINKTITWASETSALAAKTAQWVHTLSSAQSLHDVEEEQVFVWVQTNSGKVQDVSNSIDATIWVQENSASVSDISNWGGFTDLNIDQINTAVTWVNETSAVATKTAQWVQALSSAQNLHDNQEDQVFAWVQENSANISLGTNSQSDAWVEENSSIIADVVNWNGFTDLNVDQVNAATTWYQENSTKATEAVQWVEMLAETQSLHDVEEEQVFTWVQENSSNIQSASDSTAVNSWVQEQSSNIEDVVNWSGFADLNVEHINAAVTVVSETSALASKTAQWVQALSSAQNLHDVEEEQVFAWVQENSSNIQDVSDSTEVVTWVQTNSSEFNNLQGWNGFTDLNVDQVNAATTWYQENSAKATEAVQWVEMLAETQSLHNAEEDQVLTWVQENSGVIQNNTNNTEVATWVQENSSTLVTLEELIDFTDLDVNRVNEAVTIVSETSALAVKTAQWVNVLSSALNLHDEVEDQVFTWVQEHSGDNQAVLTSVNVNTWVQSNSSKLSAVEAWYDETHPDTATLNDAVNWYSTYGAKTVETTEWVDMLAEASNIHDVREESVLAWVEAHSGDITEVTNIDTNLVTWVQDHSSTLNALEEWSGFTDLNVNQVNAVATVVSETSALAAKTAQWVQALSSAQNLHDQVEDQVFTWVQENSGNTQDVSDSITAVTWVQQNSSEFNNIKEWAGFESLDVEQINTVILWYQENGAKASEMTQWVEMLAEAQSIHDTREDSVFAWVEAHSGDIVIPLESQSDTWVEDNSGSLMGVVDWVAETAVSLNEVTTIVSETSAIAAKTAQWVQALSSAQNLHDNQEDQVFAWVQENSGSVQDVSDSTLAVAWVQENSGTLYNLEQWQNSDSVTNTVDWVNTYSTTVNDAVSWYQENSAQTNEAVQWIELLAGAQDLHDSREDSVITWVEENSSKLVDADVTANTWVQNNSGEIESVVNWSGFTDLNVEEINTAITWVNEASALTTKAAEWVQVLSSAQNVHDNREDSVFAWVEAHSSINQTNTSINTWVQSHSSKLSNVETWYDENHPDTADLNNVVDWYGTYGARAAEATEWVEMLAEAQNSHEARETAVLAWVEANSGNVDDIAGDVNAWVKGNSSSVNTVVEFVESKHDTLTSLANWYTTRIVDEVATASAVSWVQEFSARTSAAALWIEAISGLEEGHEQFENQVLTWVSENSGIKAKIVTFNNWITSTSSFTFEADTWVSAHSAEIDGLLAWWRWLSGLEEGHEEFENQVLTWVSIHSADVAEVDMWVRNHSASLLQAETWVECTTAFFRTLSSWAISNSAHYDATYTWVSGMSARVLSAVIWVEEFRDPLEGLYNFYYEKENIITDIIEWYEDRHVIIDEAVNFIQDHKVEILDNITWVNDHRVAIENTITWANTSSSKYEQSYTWVRAHSTQVEEDHKALVDVQIEVAWLSQWARVWPGPWLIDAATTVSAHSGNQADQEIWSVDTGGNGGGDPCACIWDKPEPITNPLGLVEYHDVLVGKTLKEILELILYTKDLRISVNPIGYTVCPGTTVTFNVSAGPEGPVTYAWYKNNGYINGSGGISSNGNIHTIQSAQLNDVGEYYAIVTNGSKTLTSTHVTLALKDLLVFTEHPADVTLITGQTLRLSSDVTGTAPIDFVWLKDGVPLSDTTNSHYYTHVNVVTGSSGTYKVSAHNSCGTVFSDEAIVKVYAPVVITIHPQTLTTVNSGTPVTLNTAATGSLPITYKWLSGVDAQHVDVEIIGATTTTYTAQNSGAYRMIACNMVNCATSTPATIAYNVPPRVTITPHLTSVRTGTRLPISAIEITGSPYPDLQWYKNNILIGGATLNNYTIASILTSDQATYTLSATNIAGVASDSGVITVWSLLITRNPVGSAINPGQTYTMYSSAVGTEPIIYWWAKDGVVIDSTNRTSFATDQSGTYVLAASNAWGILSSTPAIITVNIPPRITLTPATTSVLTGTTLTFDGTLLEGTPTVTYKWLKNGVVIPGITTVDYTKTGLVVGDSGTYMLCATNMVGSATAESILVVNQGLIWTLHPIGSAINPGQSYTMNVSAYGTEPITYRWLSGSNTGNITTEISLDAIGNRSFTTSTSGYYRSVATNTVGSITGNYALVTVNIPPRITLTPATTSVLTGTTLLFDGTLLEGTPTVTYKWLKNGVEIPGITTVDYNKIGLVVGDSGTYMLCATNMVGSATAESVLVVNQGLVWTLHPIGSAINPGQSYTMNVSAYGTEPITYRWLSGSGTGNITTEISPAAENNRSFTTSTSGYYRSVATNLVGSITGNYALITVNIPPLITLTPATTSVLTGTTLTFDGTLLQGTLPVTYKWLKNGVVIPGITTVDYTKTGLLTADSGTYMLCATNMVGSATAESILVVNQALTITRNPVNSAINPGQTYTMYSSAVGTEPIVYWWKRDGVTITDINGTNTSLNATQSGTYVLVASNLVGTVSSTVANVTFNTLSISLNPISQTATAGATVTFTAAAVGTLPISYKWHFNGAVITGATGTTLTLTNVQEINQGDYVLEATNIVGSVSSTIATLTVNPAPALPTIYWGKILQSFATGTSSATLTATDATIRAINTYYTSVLGNTTDYPLGVYSQGLVAIKNYNGFKNIRINTEDFNQFFICDTLYSKTITTYDGNHTITFPQTLATYGFAEFFAANPSYTPGNYINMKNTFLMVFVPVGLTGTLWNKITDTGNNAIAPLALPSAAGSQYLVTLYTNGVSASYYSYRLEIDTQPLTRILTHI